MVSSGVSTTCDTSRFSKLYALNTVLMLEIPQTTTHTNTKPGMLSKYIPEKGDAYVIPIRVLMVSAQSHMTFG